MVQVQILPQALRQRDGPGIISVAKPLAVHDANYYGTLLGVTSSSTPNSG